MFKPAILICLILVCFGIAQAQTPLNSYAEQLNQSASRRVAMQSGPSDPQLRWEKELVARAVRERQSQIKRDTEKLLSLAEELKQNIDETSGNVLSVEAIKKAQEIQKLAKSVQDKMKRPY